MLEVVSFDADSTLCNTDHRHPFLDTEEVRDTDFWGRYSLMCSDDGPGPALPLAQYLSVRRDPFIVVSGRSEIARPQTMKWFHDHGVFPWAVFLCDDRHDYMPHSEWKITRLIEIQQQFQWRIKMHFDDVDSVAIEADRQKDNPLVPPVIRVHAMGRLMDRVG